jgi:hypothetical protein
MRVLAMESKRMVFVISMRIVRVDSTAEIPLTGPSSQSAQLRKDNLRLAILTMSARIHSTAGMLLALIDRLMR